MLHSLCPDKAGLWEVVRLVDSRDKIRGQWPPLCSPQGPAWPPQNTSLAPRAANKFLKWEDLKSVCYLIVWFIPGF